MSETAPQRAMSLRGHAMLWAAGAMLAGVLATYLWMSSDRAWQAHLVRAQTAGHLLYDTLLRGSDPPPGVMITPAQIVGGSGAAPVFAQAPKPSRVTSLSILAMRAPTGQGARIQLQIVSGRLTYPIARLGGQGHPAQRMGAVTRLMASYCDEPVLFARLDVGAWQRIDGAGIWGCDAAPRDLRLLALAVIIGAVIVLLSLIADTTGRFARFSQALGLRGRFGAKADLVEEGPAELRDLARTLNDFLAGEQDRLEKRAMVLSSVSHDMGTPATRLRLRTALIEDPTLRGKLEADIDQMTGMIDSVLTFTRSEMNAEPARQISLSALVAAVVADYDDVGKPVRLVETPPQAVGRSSSVFGVEHGDVAPRREDARRILVRAQPVALRRAIENLIDNALKYGRRATLMIEATSAEARIIVEDEGTAISQDRLTSLTAPFERGENAGFVKGSGLGLTIVSTIARQHGGRLDFEALSNGLRAVLTISR